MRPPRWPEAKDELLVRLRELFEVDAGALRCEVFRDGDLTVTTGRYRLARRLLIEPERSFTQRELA